MGEPGRDGLFSNSAKDLVVVHVHSLQVVFQLENVYQVVVVALEDELGAEPVVRQPVVRVTRF